MTEQIEQRDLVEPVMHAPHCILSIWSFLVIQVTIMDNIHLIIYYDYMLFWSLWNWDVLWMLLKAQSSLSFCRPVCAGRMWCAFAFPHKIFESNQLRWVQSCLVVRQHLSRRKLFWVVVSNISYFHSYLGRWSNLTNIFQMGWNHQLVLFVTGPTSDFSWR